MERCVACHDVACEKFLGIGFVDKLLERHVEALRDVKSGYIDCIINDDVKREGKFLLFYLDDYIMTSHLRMEGKYYYAKSVDGDIANYVYDGSDDINKIKKHSCVLFLLDDNSVLIYHDVRKFGKIDLKRKDTYIPFTSLSLGKEPFDMTGKELYDLIHNKSNPIKELIMNQNIISGIGNIYADEICFACKIHPCREGRLVKLKECDVKRHWLVFIFIIFMYTYS